jgi:hypothetical protein
MPNLFAGWKYRVLALALLLVYSVDYEIPRASRARLYHSIVELYDAWPLALFILFSIGAVSIALLALLLGAHWLNPKTRKRMALALVVYWLPHTVLIGHWCMLDDASAWVP